MRAQNQITLLFSLSKLTLTRPIYQPPAGSYLPHLYTQPPSALVDFFCPSDTSFSFSEATKLKLPQTGKVAASIPKGLKTSNRWL